MPYSRSFRRPSSDSQSVVQAGDNTERTRHFENPARAIAVSISNAIATIAGQPE